MKKRSHVSECAWKGALIGGPLLAVCGFVAGIVVMTAYALPIPPLMTLEAGLFVGAPLGALIGVVSAYRISRCVLFALLGTSALVGLSALVFHVSFSWINLQRLGLIAVIVGFNAGLVIGQRAPRH